MTRTLHYYSEIQFRHRTRKESRNKKKNKWRQYKSKGRELYGRMADLFNWATVDRVEKWKD